MPRHIWLALAVAIAFIIVYTLVLYMEAKERREAFRASVDKIAVPLGFDPDVVEAQASHETGNFRSIPQNSFNCFGIRWYGTRLELPYVYGTGSDGKLKYAKYRGYDHGVSEYCGMIARMRVHKPAYEVRHVPDEYMELLSASWCPEDKNYFDKWAGHLVKVKRRKAENVKQKEEVMPTEGKLSFKPVLKRLARGLVAAAAVWVTADLSPWVLELVQSNAAYGPMAVAALMAAGKGARGLLYKKFPKAAEWFPI